MFQNLLLIVLILFPLSRLIGSDRSGELFITVIILGVLLFFSLLSIQLNRRGSSMADEISKRTRTWWWMIAVFLTALTVHRAVSFVFLAFLSFAALREFFSLIPMHEQAGDKNLAFNDRAAVLLTYLAIPGVALVAYVKWYELFVILAPVYLFLLIPILFVIQNRTQGVIRSLGILVVGFMFFVYNFGYCLFMINMGPIVLLFCFALTEARDLISYWAGKYLAAVAASGAAAPVLRRLISVRIAPSVSPNKTWATGVVAAAAVAGLALLFVPFMPDFPDGRLTVAVAVVLGLLIGFFGLMGDLVFSMIKRDVGRKDSGSSLPGHGGVIDRVDSLIFTIPITFHVLYWLYF